MAEQDEPPEGEGKTSSAPPPPEGRASGAQSFGMRDPPKVEPRRERLADGMETPWRSRAAGFDAQSVTADFTVAMANAYRPAGARVRVMRHLRVSISDLHFSGAPAIYLIEREAIRLRRLRVQQFKSAVTESAAGRHADVGALHTKVADDLVQYMRPKPDTNGGTTMRKSFVQRLRKLVSLR
jgi:hypothetical protein